MPPGSSLIRRRAASHTMLAEGDTSSTNAMNVAPNLIGVPRDACSLGRWNPKGTQQRTQLNQKQHSHNALSRCGCYTWWRKDSNLRRPESTDLQSVAVDRLATPPAFPTHHSADTLQQLPRADGENRTRNRLITNQVLCQLSYVSLHRRPLATTSTQSLTTYPTQPVTSTGLNIEPDGQRAALPPADHQPPVTPRPASRSSPQDHPPARSPPPATPTGSGPTPQSHD